MTKHSLLSSAAILLMAGCGALAQTSNSGPAQPGNSTSSPPSAQSTASPQGSSTSAPAGNSASQNSAPNSAASPSSTPAAGQNASGPTRSNNAAGSNSTTAQTQGGTSRSNATNAQPPASGNAAQSGSGNAQPAAQSFGSNTAGPSQTPSGSAQQTSPQTPAAQPNQQQATQPNQQPATQPNQQQATQPNTPAQQNAGGQNAQQGRASGGVVSLNVQQRTQIGQTIARHNVKPVTNVNFSIAVGTAVPGSVQLHALPSDLVTFVPQYRGYSYFAMEEQIVIVEPSTHHIVAVVPYSGGGSRAAASAPTNARSVKLTTEQRDVVRKHVSSPRADAPARKASKRYRVGDEVEETVTVESLPETVYTEVPTLRRYRYFRQDNDLILVDPDEHRVVDVFD